MVHLSPACGHILAFAWIRAHCLNHGCINHYNGPADATHSSLDRNRPVPQAVWHWGDLMYDFHDTFVSQRRVTPVADIIFFERVMRIQPYRMLIWGIVPR